MTSTPTATTATNIATTKFDSHHQPALFPYPATAEIGVVAQARAYQAQITDDRPNRRPRLEQHQSEGHRHKHNRNKWPGLVLPWPVGFATYTFTQHDPATNRHREYRLTYQLSLWEGHTVQRSWGRCGSQHPRHHDCSFEDEEQALTYLRRLLLRRYYRGYNLSWHEGAVTWLVETGDGRERKTQTETGPISQDTIQSEPEQPHKRTNPSKG